MAMISVIVPVYKVEPYLRRCVDSILRQTFHDFELILVDDGSPDSCGDICDEYAIRDERVQVIHQANGGLSAARNAGIDWTFANSSSEYLAFVDSDDWVAENYLEALHMGVSSSDGVACVAWERVGDNDYERPSICEVKWNTMLVSDYWELEEGIVVTAWGKLYKKKLWEGIRFPIGKINEDMYTTYKVVDKVGVIAFSFASLYKYYKREDSIMAQWVRSPMDRINGFLEEIAYFESRGFNVVASKYRRQLCDNCAIAMRYLPRHDHGNKLLCRKLIRQIIHDGDLRFVDSKLCAFAAYPILARLAWPVVRFYDVVRRRGLLGAIRQLWRNVLQKIAERGIICGRERERS